MGEALSLDPARSAAVVADLEQLRGTVAELGVTLEQSLRAAELSRSSVEVVAEVSDELGALARFVAAITDEVVTADRLGSSVSGEGWFAALRAERIAAERGVWAGLGDDVGETGLDAGGFSLSASIVAIDRATWSQSAIPPGCRSFGPDAYYTGGGAVRGPDGREYPIVVPHVIRGDEHVTIDADVTDDDVATAASLDGRDAGWTVVAYRTGVERFHSEIPGHWKALMAVAFATGLRAPGTVDDAHLASIRMRLGSRPILAAGGPAPAGRGPTGGVDVSTGQGVQPHTGPVVDGRIGGRTADGSPRTKPLPTPPASPRVTAGANRVANVATLIVNGLQGVQATMAIDDADERAYEVIFEEHHDGRIRSRVQSFALEPRADGVLLAAWHLFVDDNGVLHQSPVKYSSGSGDDTGDTDDTTADDPDDDPDHDAVVAGNAHDPDLTWPAPDTIIDP